jgi:putative DNA primase/helicase
MNIDLKPDGRILWYDFATNDGGDAVRLIQILDKVSRKEAILHVRSNGGFNISTKPIREITPNEKNRDRNAQIWQESLPANAPEAEPLRRYLANRGLYEILQNIPENLRFHPQLLYWDDKRKLASFHPAMVAKIEDWHGNLQAIHRTYLTSGGYKADVKKPKKVTSPLTTLNGSAIRLGEPNEGRLIVAEGIETALAVYLITGIPTWATVSALGMQTLDIPNNVNHLSIAIDHDFSRTGERAGQVLAMRAHHYGTRCFILQPADYLPLAADNYDWLDVYNVKKSSAITLDTE